MINLYFWNTPNGYKPLLLLEEAHIDYQLHPVNIGAEQQFRSEFLKISPNNKIPAITDTEISVDGRPLRLFESGAILLYLAEKSGQFLNTDASQRAETLQWLFWQVGGVGPIFGQSFHFSLSASQHIDYAVDRFVNETSRLLSVLDWRLNDREFVAGNYSIADMALYPWVVEHPSLSIKINDYANVSRWLDLISQRPTVKRAYQIGQQVRAAAAA
ncbi:MAG: thiol:disulfide oxidoreductase [Gammaproteobacteria bacterium]|nr:MAG: thiol:disulfide oxidoreductase [Gammaproteobacteria bacterium]RLA16005.1 MAG: thiol:disulfide oxidoreductase [Gammaproteobacteria bacterium]